MTSSTTSASPLVAILMGSASDADKLTGARDVLQKLGIAFEVTVTSAHRSPARTVDYVRSAEERGVRVFIAAAGGAAHLAGVVAAHTLKPVIGVPVDSTPLAGFDALLSTVQMPPGIPVATVAVGDMGARNAAYLAARILGLGDAAIAATLVTERDRLEASVVEGDRKVKSAWATAKT